MRMKCKVRISPFFVFLVCAAVFCGYVRIVVTIFAAAFLHELAHVIALRLCKVKIEEVAIGLLGAEIKTEPMCYRQEIVCAAVGPLMNMMLCLVSVHDEIFAVCNLVLFVYNSLPVYPLDGGRILRSILLLKMPIHRANYFCKTVAFVVCSLLMLLSVWFAILLELGTWPIFLAGLTLGKLGWFEWENTD